MPFLIDCSQIRECFYIETGINIGHLSLRLSTYEIRSAMSKITEYSRDVCK